MNQITRNDVTAIITLTHGEDWALGLALGKWHDGLEGFVPYENAPAHEGLCLTVTAENEEGFLLSLMKWQLAKGQTPANKRMATKIIKKIDGALDRKAADANEQNRIRQAEDQARYDRELAQIANMRARAEHGFVPPVFETTFSECYDKRHMEWGVKDTFGYYENSRRWDIRANLSVVDGRPVMRYEVDAPMLSATEWENNRRILCDSYEDMMDVVAAQADLFGKHLTSFHFDRYNALCADVAYLDAMAASTELVSA